MTTRTTHREGVRRTGRDLVVPLLLVTFGVLAAVGLYFVVPGFQNRYYLIKLEFSKGLPRLRIEEVKLEKRRMGD